jgi:hypothetical protein
MRAKASGGTRHCETYVQRLRYLQRRVRCRRLNASAPFFWHKGFALTHDHPHPRLWVDEAFDHLLPLEVLVLSTRVVESDTLDGDVFLVIGEPPGAGRVAGQDEHGGYGKDDGDQAADEEDELVRVELAGGVTKAIGEERAEDRSHAVGRVPDVVAERLLATGPPHGDDDQHRGRDRRLERAEDESPDGQTGKLGERGHDAEGRAPAEEAEADP